MSAMWHMLRPTARLERAPGSYTRLATCLMAALHRPSFGVFLSTPFPPPRSTTGDRTACFLRTAWGASTTSWIAAHRPRLYMPDCCQWHDIPEPGDHR